MPFLNFDRAAGLAQRVQAALAPLLGPMLRTGQKSVSLVIIAVVPLFLVFANTQIKELFERFVGGCIFVVEKKLTDENRFDVVAQLSGVPPKMLPLQFEGHDSKVNFLMMLRPHGSANEDHPDDLSAHPKSGQECPGQLCDAPEVDQPEMLVKLQDLRPEFAYHFRVRMLPDPGKRVTDDSLRVYALFEDGLEGGVCRVQSQRWYNFWVWASPVQKTLLFLGILVVGGLLFSWTKRTSEVNNEPK